MSEGIGHSDGYGGVCTCCVPDMHRPTPPDQDYPGLWEWLLGIGASTREPEAGR